MIAIGADAQNVSILAAMVYLLLSFLCIKAPALIERFGLTRKGAIQLASLNIVAWLPITFIFLLPQASYVALWFALLWLINLIPAVLLSTQRDNWLSNTIPKDRMGRYLGKRLAIRSAFYVGAFCFSGYILDIFTGNNLIGFSVIFTIAIVAALANLVIYFSMKESTADSGSKQELKQTELKLFEFFKDLKERKLSKFILFTSLFGLTVSICGPLYAVYMLKELQFSYFIFTLVLASEYLARVVSVPFWGRFADRVGNIRVLGIVSHVIPFVPICWLFCSNAVYLVFIQLISGLCWGAYDLCIQNYLYKVAPPATKLRYIIYTRSITLLCMAFGGLIGVYLLNDVFMIAGSRILSIFLVSGIFRLLVVLTILPRIIDLALSFVSTKERPVIDWITVNNKIASKAGLYYHPEQQEKYLEIVEPLKADNVYRNYSAGTSKDGLYYHPERWGNYSDMLSTPLTTNLRRERKVIIYNGLYYDTEGWARYTKDSLQAIIEER